MQFSATGDVCKARKQKIGGRRYAHPWFPVLPNHSRSDYWSLNSAVSRPEPINTPKSGQFPAFSGHPDACFGGIPVANRGVCVKPRQKKQNRVRELRTASLNRSSQPAPHRRSLPAQSRLTIRFRSSTSRRQRLRPLRWLLIPKRKPIFKGQGSGSA